MIILIMPNSICYSVFRNNMFWWIFFVTFFHYLTSNPINTIPTNQTKSTQSLSKNKTVDWDYFLKIQRFRQKIINDFRERILTQLNDTDALDQDSVLPNMMSKSLEVNSFETESDIVNDVLKLKKSSECEKTVELIEKSISCFYVRLPNPDMIESVVSGKLIVPSQSMTDAKIEKYNLDLLDSDIDNHNLNDSWQNSDFVQSENVIQVKIEENMLHDLEINITNRLEQIITKSVRSSVINIFFRIGVSNNSNVLLTDLIDPNNMILELQLKQKPKLQRSKRRTNLNKCTDNSVFCCLRHITVTLEDLQFTHYILSPQKFNLYYCQGICDYDPLNNYINNNSNSEQSRNGHRRRSRQTGPCCAPSSYVNLNVMITENTNQVRIRTVRDVLVNSCGCL